MSLRRLTLYVFIFSLRLLNFFHRQLRLMSRRVLVPVHARFRLLFRLFSYRRLLLLLFDSLINHHVVHAALETREQFALIGILNRSRSFVLGCRLNCGRGTTAVFLVECLKDFRHEVYLELVADDLARFLRFFPHLANIFSGQSSLGHDTLELGQLNQKSI